MDGINATLTAESIYSDRPREKCFRCGMSFVIGSPESAAHGGSPAERLICSECKRRFWCAGSANNVTVCGVER